ncbi:hypothetical protein Goari_016069, partial [Gossypium aridum]|nr:hypothetical protein [Gossypium aridum]
VGLAHGFLLVGPFVKAGPLRNTAVAGQAGSLAAAGLVIILSICLTMYGVASFNEGEPSTAPSLTLTGRKKEPDQLQTAEGWAKFSGGFFFGGISGANITTKKVQLVFISANRREAMLEVDEDDKQKQRHYNEDQMQDEGPFVPLGLLVEN